MKIESKVCSLQQARRLRELGILPLATNSWVERYDKAVFCTYYDDGDVMNPQYAAFDVAELGIMLPREYSHTCKLWDGAEASEDNVIWCCGAFYKCFLNGSTEGKTQAEAMAAQLIYLLENNHITASEVNNRLTHS